MEMDHQYILAVSHFEGCVLGRTHPLCPKPRIKMDCYSTRDGSTVIYFLHWNIMVAFLK